MHGGVNVPASVVIVSLGRRDASALVRPAKVNATPETDCERRKKPRFCPLLSQRATSALTCRLTGPTPLTLLDVYALLPWGVRVESSQSHAPSCFHRSCSFLLHMLRLGPEPPSQVRNCRMLPGVVAGGGGVGVGVAPPKNKPFTIAFGPARRVS